MHLAKVPDLAPSREYSTHAIKHTLLFRCSPFCFCSASLLLSCLLYRSGRHLDCTRSGYGISAEIRSISLLRCDIDDVLVDPDDEAYERSEQTALKAVQLTSVQTCQLQTSLH